MNFIEFESPQKLRGGYYTKPDVATFLARWVLAAEPKRILEPACGDGIFFEAMAKVGPGGIETVVGCEIDPTETARARERAKALEGVVVEVHAGDFLSWYLERRS